MQKLLWPELSFEKNKDTYYTLHLWSQIIGKIKLATMPWINHSWHVTLLVTPAGLTTGDLAANDKHFQITLNFCKHVLEIVTSAGEEKTFSLLSLSVAGCYKNVLQALEEFGISVKINATPNELQDPKLFYNDEHNTYQPEVASALHIALLNSNDVFTRFRAQFSGKCSPVHFFWGSFDLAVSRFSGRPAPQHPGGVPNLPDWVAREAYSHEVSSSGFWPGNEALPFAAYYNYIYPEPNGFNKALVKPSTAYYHKDLREFILPYDDVRLSDDPVKTLLDFLETTYKAAAECADWDVRPFEMKKY